jgi:hypothetical protein
MLKTALTMLIAGGLALAALGQAQDASGRSASGGKVNDEGAKVDRTAAYYHYALAHYYAQMALTSQEANRAEYRDKATEHYEAAIKADPAAPRPRRPIPLPILRPLPR